MDSGQITVTGQGETSILLKGYPTSINVHFLHDTHHIPCDPHHHHDRLSYHLGHEDEDIRHHHDLIHQHHNRKFFLIIDWEVSGVRTIRWSVKY